MNLTDDAVSLFKYLFHGIALDEDVSVISVQDEFTFFWTVDDVIDINKKKKRTEYWALWNTKHNGKMVRWLFKKLGILGSISEITSKEVMSTSSNTFNATE